MKKVIKPLLIIIPVICLILCLSYLLTGRAIWTFKDIYIFKIIHEHERIISFCDNKTAYLQFQNLNNKVALIYYELEVDPKGFKKIDDGKEPLKTKSKSFSHMSWNEFKIILNNISNIINENFEFDEFNRIKYGGEHVNITTEQINKILSIL